MRILHLVHQYAPEHLGGVELYTQSLARYQIGQLGHEAAVLYPSEREAEGASLRQDSDAAGVRVYAVRLGARSRAQVFLSTFGQKEIGQGVAAALDEFRPTIVHVQHLMGMPAGVVEQALATRAPVIITLHDYWFPCANAQLVTNYDGSVCEGPRWWLNCGRCAVARAGVKGDRWLAPTVAPLMALRSHRLRRVLAWGQRVIAPTHFVRDTYARLGMPADNIVVVPHGIEVPAHVRAATSQEQRRDGPLHIVYVGSLAWQKGVHVLVDAVNEIEAGKVRLSIYGGLDKYPEYVAALRGASRHPGIHFGGRIGREALWQLLSQKADVVVVPSIWYETSSLVTQEAFAAGVPVVASQLGALAERVTDGVDGLLFPPGDASALRERLMRLQNDGEFLDELRANIRPQRTMKEHVADVDAIYRGALAERNG